jgi:hypothetical protein
MRECDELQRQFRAAVKPPSEPGEDRRDKCDHAGDITVRRAKSPVFSIPSEFSARTAGETEVDACAAKGLRNRDKREIPGSGVWTLISDQHHFKESS